MNAAKKKRVIEGAAALWFVISIVLVVMLAGGICRAESVAYLNTETLSVSGGGQEEFSSLALDPNYSYLAKVSGVVEFDQGGLFSDIAHADALYRTDENKNFTEPLAGDQLRFSAYSSLVSADRATHEYVFRLLGDGKRLSVRFPFLSAQSKVPGFRVELARSDALSAGDQFIATVGDGGIIVAVLVTALLVLFGVGAWLENSPEDLERSVRAKEHERGKQWERWRRALEETHKDHPHREMDSWIEDYARARSRRLLAAATNIEAENKKFHRDAPDGFIAGLKRDDPGLYRRATWRKRALAVAERLEGSPPRPQRRTMNSEEYRAYMLRRERIRMDDKIERARGRVEGILEAREMLEGYELDEEDRNRLGQDLLEDLLNEERPDGKVL